MVQQQYVTRPYRYADGVAYRPNLHCIHPIENGEAAIRKVGGLVELNGKYLAFAARSGASHLIQGKIDRIIKCADAVAWGSTKREALLKIKGALA